MQSALSGGKLPRGGFSTVLHELENEYKLENCTLDVWQDTIKNVLNVKLQLIDVCSLPRESRQPDSSDSNITPQGATATTGGTIYIYFHTRIEQLAFNELVFDWTRKRDWSRRKVVIALEESSVPVEMNSDQDDDDVAVSESLLHRNPYTCHITKMMTVNPPSTIIMTKRTRTMTTSCWTKTMLTTHNHNCCTRHRLTMTMILHGLSHLEERHFDCW